MRSLLPVVASLLPLLLLLAQLASVSGTFGGYSEDGTLWKCSSRNTTSSLSSSSASSEAGAAGPAGSHPGEVTCSCDGINMTSVPPVMPKMHRLVIENSLGMEVLRKDALQPYSASLSDV
ncbi:uncharacterized protein LOC127750080 [Frankliniella occidentalis]|uniref:Uncharacterized protein LOC127750080 n=1 Tax=Frankliniella occidentalis TaxID=133901 RepID=A0A9C6UAJ8_FRAOC|nr:uncharacterized protein LOC127750080 [Frankliniella occidentalis]